MCQDPNGSKYKAALKWNIPVVSGEWLFACAASGTLAPIDDYPLVEGVSVTECRSDACPSDCLDDDKTTSFGEDAKTDNVGVVQEEVCMETSDASAEPLASLTKTEGQSVVSGDPLPGDSVSGQTRPMKRPSIYNRPFRPSFDLAEVMDELASPACPSIRGRKSRASRNSFPLDDFFAENIKQTLQKLGTVAPPSKDGKNGYDNGDGKANGECPEREVKNVFLFYYSLFDLDSFSKSCDIPSCRYKKMYVLLHAFILQCGLFGSSLLSSSHHTLWLETIAAEVV